MRRGPPSNEHSTPIPTDPEFPVSYVRVLAVATGMFSRDEIAAGEPDQLLMDLGDTGRVVSILVE